MYLMSEYIFIRVSIFIVFIIIAWLSSISVRSPYYGVSMRREDSLANRIRVFFRRKNVLRNCKKFVSKKNKAIILKNDNTVFVYDTKNKTFLCMNAKNIQQSIAVEWGAQFKALKEDKYDNTFEKTFDQICAIFNQETTYKELNKLMRKNFDDVIETEQPSNEKIKKDLAEDTNNNICKININTASENALAQLPGMTIEFSRKIIQRIKSKGDFLSVAQMYEEIKIDEELQKQLNDYIYTKPTEKIEKKVSKNYDDRIIDM